MIFTKEKIFDVCRSIAPAFKFEPELIQAVCLQEGGRNKDGTFAPDRARLENGFYSRYVERNDLATTSEVLLSASYGVMQIMGLELMRMGYMKTYYLQCPVGTQAVLKDPLSQLAIPSAIDAFCENLNWQIEWGCKLMAEKREKAGGNIEKMLLYWNGGGNKEYDNEVLEKYRKIKGLK